VAAGPLKGRLCYLRLEYSQHCGFRLRMIEELVLS
jgi:hypothetical protein